MASKVLLTHKQRVLRLYKKAVRHLECSYYDRIEFRHAAVITRARFEEHKATTDLKFALTLLESGEKEFWEKQHPMPYIYIDSPGGTRYERDIPSPEWVLDHWHPHEKAQYPTYFAKREKRFHEEKEHYKELLAEEEELVKAGKLPTPPPSLGIEDDTKFHVPK